MLEREHGDVQDIEFTVERGRLYLLQSRAAKRSPQAAVRIAVELADEGAIDRDEALRRVTPEQIASACCPAPLEEVTAAAEVIARGTPACPGVAAGRAVAHSHDAEARTTTWCSSRPRQARRRQRHDRRARRGHRAGRLHLARRGRHARTRTPERRGRRRERDRGLGAAGHRRRVEGRRLRTGG